jgi:hypothetical protein
VLVRTSFQQGETPFVVLSERKWLIAGARMADPDQEAAGG